MTIRESKLVKLVNQLTRATVEDKIAWEINRPPSSLFQSADNQIEFYCEAGYKEQTVAVFERRIVRHDLERDIDVTVSVPSLAIISIAGVPWEGIERPSALATLLRMVREKALGIDELIDALLD